MPRRLVDLEEPTYRKLEVLAFVLRTRRLAALDLAIEALLAADPDLAAQIEAIERAGLPPEHQAARPPTRRGARRGPQLPVGPGRRAGW